MERTKLGGHISRVTLAWRRLKCNNKDAQAGAIELKFQHSLLGPGAQSGDKASARGETSF
jgi:hypothetical protein